MGGGVGLRVGESAGSGRDVGQDSLEQPAPASRHGGGGQRHTWAGACRATGSVAWRRLGHGRGAGPDVVPCLGHEHGHGRGAGPDVVPRLRLRLHGRATARGRHRGARVPRPGAARRSRIVLHLPLPSIDAHWAGVGNDNGLGDGFVRVGICWMRGRSGQAGRAQPPCASVPAGRIMERTEGRVAQLVRARGSHPRGPGFESLRAHHFPAYVLHRCVPSSAACPASWVTTRSTPPP